MPTNIGNRIVPTAFRKLFNAAFYKYSFVLIDSNFSVADRHFVSFFADGKIKGFNAFTHFYLYLNGKQNNIENAMALEVTNSKTKTILGLKNYPDSIELFTIAKNLNASKKPYFICNKKTATLIKQKWY
jgi:hypothetical protein